MKKKVWVPTEKIKTTDDWAFPKPVKKAREYKPYTFNRWKKKKKPSVEGIDTETSVGTSAFPKPVYIKKKKKKELSPRKAIVKKLDTVVSLIIRKREPFCVTCPNLKGKALQNGHLFSRQSYKLRWDIRPNGNCHTQCQSCNYSHEIDQYPYFKWYIDKFGLDQFEQLRYEYKAQMSDWKQWELEELYEKLCEEARKLGIDI